jgi:(2R)-sulfolactate sulfo-lyase subunit alpha
VEPAIRALHGLIHNEGDHVAVSVRDVDPGPARLVYMDTEREVELDVLEQVPLGHKVALTDLADGADVIEYGARIGLTRRPIRKGELVHVHNLRSARWGTAR